jgi:hypothetical protein
MGAFPARAFPAAGAGVKRGRAAEVAKGPLVPIPPRREPVNRRRQYSEVESAINDVRDEMAQTLSSKSLS